ncbi:TadE/TadG family type IV pilus assembly protein [Polycladidibacter hongkongensis]|uniref:TadE/TadG family type IV pilus assembly protein n=1 Tax=Polycladidibacter hongkongensis TaxID=1647556 RepID=UPI00083325A4|nr:TadE/TadG family type IV pilus assembly protein [Pseudovibrio hongkongensis]
MLFFRDERGVVAPITALMIVVLIAIAGASIDFGRAFAAKQKVAQALDVAALQVIGNIRYYKKDRTKALKDFEDAFNAAMTGKLPSSVWYSISDVQFDFVESTIDAQGKAKVPTYFIRVLNMISGEDDLDTLTVVSDTRAEYGTPDLEISVVVDLTGSMNSHVKSLQNGVEQLIAQVLPSDIPRDKLRAKVAIIPYSAGVRLPVNKETRKVLDPDFNMRSYTSVCALERRSSLKASKAEKKWNFNPKDNYFYGGADPGKKKSYFGVMRSGCPSTQVQGLTQDRAQLERRIKSFKATGYTAGHTGLNWGYLALSPSWGSFWGAAKPKSYSDKSTRKILIFMTDGQFVTYFYKNNKTWFGRNYSGDATSISNARGLRVCEEMKKRDIDVYTLFYKTTRNTTSAKAAEQVLKDCATGPSYHFFARDKSDLVQMFEVIGARLSELFLSR